MNVYTQERSVGRQNLRRSVHCDMPIRQFLAALAGVCQQNAGPTVDVDPRIRRRGTRSVGKCVEALFHVGSEQDLAQVSQDGRTLMKGELLQGRNTHAAGVFDHGGHIDARRRQRSHGLAGDGVFERDASRGRHPFATHVAFHNLHASPCSHRYDTSSSNQTPSACIMIGVAGRSPDGRTHRHRGRGGCHVSGVPASDEFVEAPRPTEICAPEAIAARAAANEALASVLYMAA